MAYYSDKQSLELAITAKMVAKLSTENGVADDNVVEFCCKRSDAMILSKIAQFYVGPHPIAAPTALSILNHAGTLYAQSYLYARDPTWAKTYVDISKDPSFKQAETIMNQLQTNSRCLYDNAPEPFLAGGIVSPDRNQLNCAPQLFGENYYGDLLCLQQE